MTHSLHFSPYLSHTFLQYNLLLYASRDKYKCSAKISGSFKFTLQAGNYVSFYDDHRTAWSLHFDTSSDLSDIAKQVAICRANSGDISSVIVQDLVLGEGQVGVSVLPSYTFCL